MPQKKRKEELTRMLHLRIPESLHRQVRIRVAELDTSIQEWVVDIVKKTLKKRKYGKDGV